MEIYFVTHATSVDNEAGIRFGAICCSSLRRSVETARIAFGERHPIRSDARLNEVDYGDYTGMPVWELDVLCPRHVEVPFPNGESYRQRLMLVEAFLAQIRQQDLAGALLIVGHRATKWSLDVLVDDKMLADIVTEPLGWRAY